MISLFDEPLSEDEPCRIYGNKIIFTKTFSEQSETEKEVSLQYILDNVFAGDFWYDYINEEFSHEVRKLDMFKPKEILHGTTISRNNLCSPVASSFHPHILEINNGKYNSPNETLEDTVHLKKCISNYLKITSGSINCSDAIHILRTARKTQMVSNFRPTVAKLIYETYGNNGSVLDPCMGYGGRLLGAWCSNISSYTGIDPCTKTFDGNIKLQNRLIELTSYKGSITEIIPRPTIILHKLPFEDFTTNEKFDLVFTSPPYFNTEKYSNEDTQSWKRYPTYYVWVDKFLEILIHNAHTFLKPGGVFAINMKDDPLAKYNIWRDVIRLSKKYFGEPETILYMEMPALPLIKKNCANSIKGEPIGIFRKKL